MHAGETAQRQFRLRNRGMNVAEIDLRHFVAVKLAGILQRERHFRRAVSGNFFRLKLAALEIELGVAQTVTKGIKRFAAEVAVSAIGHRVIGESRQVRRGTVERDWEVAGGIDLAEENFG